jgi:hypothetical protein
MTEATRAWIYRVVLVALALAAAYGLLEGEDVDLWAQLVTAILGIGASGLAAKNTSTKGP